MGVVLNCLCGDVMCCVHARPGLQALLAMRVPLKFLRTEAADCLVSRVLLLIILVQLIGSFVGGLLDRVESWVCVDGNGGCECDTLGGDRGNGSSSRG